MTLPPVADSLGPMPFSIGSDVWPGLAKLAEELGELQQVIAKLMAYPSGEHPDGAGHLNLRLLDEMADVDAASRFVVDANKLDLLHVEHRCRRKLRRFHSWHRGEDADA